MTWSRQEWLAAFEAMAKAFKRRKASADLLLIGSVPLMLAGHHSRTSEDVDVWLPLSTFDREHLAAAAKAAKLLLDPLNENPGQPYIQLVQPGIAQIGKFSTPTKLMTLGPLTIWAPPIANLIASKLLRASVRDIDDLGFLLALQPERRDIDRAIASMPARARSTARENLIYLDVIE